MVERKYYDLTPSQKLMYFALKFIPEKNVVNIGTAVWFHENIDCELLKAAAYKAIWRMDALRLRLKKVKGQIKQYVSEEEPKEIKIEDYSNYSKDHIDEILEKVKKYEDIKERRKSFHFQTENQEIICRTGQLSI